MPLVTRSYAEVVRDRVDQLVDLRRRKLAGEKVNLFVPTGLRDWDAIGGIPYGVLTVIGAGTGEGKSILKNHVVRAAATAGLDVLVVDQEDPEDKTADRTLAGVTGLDSKDIGLLDYDDLAEAQLLAAVMDVEGWGSHVYYYQGLVTPDEAQELWLSHPSAALVVTDYLQATITPKGQSKEECLRLMTQNMEIDAQNRTDHVMRAHFALSQLKGDVEKRGNDRLDWSKRKSGERPDISGFRPGPGSGDLAWSEGISQHAKLVGYWWRPGRWEKRAGVSGAKDNRGEILLPKVSFAGEGRIPVGFDGPTARLSDWDRSK